MSNRAKPTLVLLRPFRDRDLAYLHQQLDSCFEIVEPPSFDDTVLERFIGEADVVLGGRITPHLMSRAGKLKLVQTPGAGLDGLDLKLLLENGIMVANSHSNASYVAEYALGMLLTLTKKLTTNDRQLRSGSSPSFEPTNLSGSLFGARIGLWGLGHIGRVLLELLQPWQTSFLAYARRPDRHVALINNFPRLSFVTQEQILRAADAHIITLPVTHSTREIIDAQAFDLMKPGTLLINVSRAEVINRDALLHALRNGKLGGVGLDVWWLTNIVADIEDFLSFDNVLLGAHRAGTHSNFAPHLKGVIENLRVFAETGKPVDLVDPIEGY
ncbi:MAG: hypothetical protein HYV59_04180 [Planctomycetes bacterium]|nr:hypothetical protein [Planctomycetota bacterium]